MNIKLLNNKKECCCEKDHDVADIWPSRNDETPTALLAGAKPVRWSWLTHFYLINTIMLFMLHQPFVNGVDHNDYDWLQATIHFQIT